VIYNKIYEKNIVKTWIRIKIVFSGRLFKRLIIVIVLKESWEEREGRQDCTTQLQRASSNQITL